jgi:hypothetical protein
LDFKVTKLLMPLGNWLFESRTGTFDGSISLCINQHKYVNILKVRYSGSQQKIRGQKRRDKDGGRQPMNSTAVHQQQRQSNEATN